MHEEIEGIAQMARSMIEDETSDMDESIAATQTIFYEHVEAGRAIAERVDDFTKALWLTHANAVPMPMSLAARWPKASVEEAYAALGSTESVTTDVEALRSLITDVGIIVSHVHQREGHRHYSLTGGQA